MSSPEELVVLVDQYGQPQTDALPRPEAFAKSEAHPDLFVPIAVVVAANKLGGFLVQQRAVTKPVDGGKLDFVCGVVSLDEDPSETAFREAEEETGVELINIRKIAEGLNNYRRYRYLFAAEAMNPQGMTVTKPNSEVEWAAMIDRYYLDLWLKHSTYPLVGDFQAHLDMIRASREEPEVSDDLRLAA